MKSKIKTIDEIEKMRKAGKIVAKVHQLIREKAVPGVNLLELDKLAYDFIIKENGKPLFLNFQGYPATICASVNSVLVHGIPHDYILKDSDLLSIDVGVRYQGYCADAAFTMNVGKISIENKKILDASKEVFEGALELIAPNQYLGNIGHFIEKRTRELGYNVSKQYVGHFIGKEMHEDPLVLNHGKKFTGLILKEGMTFCIEPILIDGKEDLMVDPIDNWSVRTKHGGKTTHFEHTILVTNKGYEILTKI